MSVNILTEQNCF